MKKSITLFLFSCLCLAAIPKTTAPTAPMKYCDTDNLAACFQNRETANHGFYMIHKNPDGTEKRTKHVALLVHGLSDSPYFYRDIAQIVFNQGMNVVAIRTTGHGTEKSHISDVSRFDWYQDMKYGMSLAKSYGDNVILAGMSLGGALVVREAQVNPDVKGLMLFSAAFKMPGSFRVSCYLANGVTKWPIKLVGGLFTDTEDYQARKEYGVGVRYQGIHNNATCQTVLLADEIEKIAKRRVKKAKKKDKDVGLYFDINIPVYNVVSEFDTAIDVEHVTNFSSQISSNQRGASYLVFYGNSETEDTWSYPQRTFSQDVSCMNHASVLLQASPEMGYTEEKCDFSSSEEAEKFNNEPTYDMTPEINFNYDLVKDSLNEFLSNEFQ